MSRLADRQIEIVLRNRVVFGVGAVSRLPEMVAAAGGSGAFVVTDPGVVAAGVVQRALDLLAKDSIPVEVFDEVEPNPAGATVERGAAALRAFRPDDAVIVAIGGGSAMDAAKAIALRAANDRPLWELGYDGPALTPGRPIVAIPTTAGTGSEAHPFAVITHEEIGRKDYVGHPSLLPCATILDPGLTLGLPAGVTAATGVDALTHSLESLLSRNGNPFAEATALGVIRTVSEWLPRAVLDGSDLEARSQMLMASHLAGVGQASGTGVGLIHALGHALGTRGRVAHGTALAVVLPEVLSFYAAEPGLRDRELALVGVALRAASTTEQETTAAGAAIGELRRVLASLGQRPTLRSLGFDEATLDIVAQDAIDDVAIRNSPRLPSLAEARAILGSVLD
ncbi:MAG TPA: iron-containing alcohol dehydrogenase [Candidatus Limnocylindrales bacterium]|nr:iron-containing alcohol dehydrogenase [Candidatus Limnocylindrales bacterium]